jgi:penicillin-insensitive murein endopeptidase
VYHLLLTIAILTAHAGGKRGLHGMGNFLSGRMSLSERAPTRMPWPRLQQCMIASLVGAVFACNIASAQDKGSINPEPLPPLAHPEDPKLPAKELFGRKTTPAALQTHTIGFYAKGCLAGGVALPVNGKTWQVMRVSRNRNWGHPSLVEFLERLADQASTTGWRGLLLGDMSQPRGGPMRNGHASHQVGLDADIWLTPMPDHELTRAEREEMMATLIVRPDGKDVDPKVWTPAHVALIKAAAEDPHVARIFVNAAIKKALCRDAGKDRKWLSKVQPWWGHDWHFHVRLSCPSEDPECKPQPPRPADEGCGAKELDHWMIKSVEKPKPDAKPDAKPAITASAATTPPATTASTASKGRPGPRMADLPAACRQVLFAP